MLRVNDTNDAAYDHSLAVNAAETILAITAQYLLALGDYVELYVRQTAAGQWISAAGSHIEKSLSVTRIAA